jgi:hypothetical protein
MVKRFFKNLLISILSFIIAGIILVLVIYSIIQCVWFNNWWWITLPIATVIIWATIDETNKETPA